MSPSCHKSCPQRALALSLFILGIVIGTPARPTPELLEASPAVEVDASLPLSAAQIPEPQPSEDTGQSTPLTRKQRKDLLKHNFEKMKRDADELVDLAKALQDELSKSNENVLSLQVVNQAEKIEKLAKRIKNAARGY